MGVEGLENVISLPRRSPALEALPEVEVSGPRVFGTLTVRGQDVMIRQATELDVPAIQALYHQVYQGNYSVEFATNPDKLGAQLARPDRYLLLVAEVHSTSRIVGSILYSVDSPHRLGKAAGVVVSPEYRSGGLGSALLTLGSRYLAEEVRAVDVLYATSRTINEGPSRVVAEAGFHQVGLFPNAVQVDSMEHLNLDVYVTARALPARRRRPYIFQPYHEIYEIARKRLGLERATVVREYSPLSLSPVPLRFDLITDESLVQERFDTLNAQRRLANSFFPFHAPNLLFRTSDGNTEVFASMRGSHRQAAILGYRTDLVAIHDVLDSVARALHKHGAAYVEFLVDAHDYRLQQQAFTARYIPSAYFPAMRLAADGQRDDVIVVSRTFSLLDFTGSVMKGDNLKYLKAYLRHYHELYIAPILGKS